jgi:hypothetical protein
MVAASSGAARDVRRLIQITPGMARGSNNQISTGKISSQRESGVQDMSEENLMLARSGSAQKAAMAKPQTQMASVRQNPFRHGRTKSEANITTIVVRM